LGFSFDMLFVDLGRPPPFAVSNSSVSSACLSSPRTPSLWEECLELPFDAPERFEGSSEVTCMWEERRRRGSSASTAGVDIDWVVLGIFSRDGEQAVVSLYQIISILT